MFKFITTRLILNHINNVNIKNCDHFHLKKKKHETEEGSDFSQQKNKPKVFDFNHQKNKPKASDFYPQKNDFPEKSNMVVILPCCELLCAERNT